MARNFFTRFDEIVKMCGEGRPYAVDCYLQYTDEFSKDDRSLIEDFRKKYIAKQCDVSVIDTYPDGQIAVLKKFLGFVRDLPENDRAYKKRLKLAKKQAEKDAQDKDRVRKDFSTTENFLNNRYHRSQKYFSDSASSFKKKYYFIQKLVMILSLSVSVFSLFMIFLGNTIWSEGSLPKWFGNLDNFIVAAISAAAAWFSSNDKLYRNLEFWVKYRTISEALKKEYDLYQGRCGVYDIADDSPDEYGHTQAEKKFRVNYEEIVQRANDSFVSILQSDISVPLGAAPDKYANILTDGGAKMTSDALGGGKGEKKDGDK